MAKAYTLTRSQHIKASPAQVRYFLASPANFSGIAPPGIQAPDYIRIKW